ncbi:MAG: lipopolysaccharide assembly protein LapB [Pseudomonadota bacterium]
MLAWLWFLLPIAALSGWVVAKRSSDRNDSKRIPGEYLQGLNYLLNEEQDKAIDVFVNMVDLDSDTVETHIVLGNLFRRRGEVNRAIRIHQNLIARADLDETTKADALLELAKDYFKAGLLDRAENLLLGVLDTNTHKIEAYELLRVVYEQEKEWEKAITCAHNLQLLTNNHQGKVIAHYHCEVGELVFTSENNKKGISLAAKHAKKALSFDKECGRANILLGDISFCQKDYKTAIKQYCRSLEKLPEYSVSILKKLKQSFFESEDRTGFIEYLKNIRMQHDAHFPYSHLVEHFQESNDFIAIDELFKKEFSSNAPSIFMLREYVQAIVDNNIACDKKSLERILSTITEFLEGQSTYICEHCGYEANNLFWQCPSCHLWETQQSTQTDLKYSQKKTTYTV